MEINKAILHVLDANSGNPIFSNDYLDLESSLVRKYIEEQILKVHKDVSKRTSNFSDDGFIYEELCKYKDDTVNGQDESAKSDDFKNLSQKIGEKYYSNLIQSIEPELIDFLMVDYDFEGFKYLALLFMKCKLAFNHNIFNQNMSMVNQLVPKFDTLPSATQKIDTFAIINLENLEVDFSDKLNNVNGRDIFILQEEILMCEKTKTSVEVIREISKVTKKVAEDFGIDTIKVANKTKQYFMEVSSNDEEEINIEDCVAKVFEDEKQAIGQAKEKIKEVEIPIEIKVDKELAFNKNKTHKIKTDTGVTISFPSDMLNDSDLIEVINKPDGTKDILIKNINSVTNR